MSIPCPGCGKLLKQITNTHIKHFHPEFSSLPEFRTHYNLEKTWAKELREDFSKSQTGKQRKPYVLTQKSKDAQRRRAEKLRGLNHWNYGRSWSDESKNKIRSGMVNSSKWQQRLEWLKTEEAKQVSTTRAFARVEKTLETKASHGIIVTADNQDQFAHYCRLVIGVTQAYFRRYQWWIDPNKQKTDGWQIDHMVSKHQGFLQNINPVLIGGAPNLMMLPKHMNRNKWIRSSISVDDLMTRWSVFLSRGHGKAPKAHKYWESQAENIIVRGRFSNSVCLDLYDLPDDLVTMIPDLMSLPFVKS